MCPVGDSASIGEGDDELGSLNYIDKGKIKKAGTLLKEGKVYRLSHVMSDEMPYRMSHGPFFYTTTFRPVDYHEPFRPASGNEFGANIGRLEMSDHSGTHLDSLNHISRGGRFYNGVDAIGGNGPKGTIRLGIESTPAIVTRGILFNGCKARGVDLIESGPIEAKEVDNYFRDMNINVEPGDALLIYTGVSRLWDQKERFMEFYNRCSGIGMDLAKWIVKNRISVAGVDTPSSEVIPSEIPGHILPVHQYLLADNGVRLIDNMDLADVSASSLREFMFVCSPIPIRGATASPVSPLALI
ncbi:MAG: cyclase family protein [Candidatus Thermoplasmatota archaeon]|nr:cyclase family protein [Candidatus Thermoplasmatota archaeon]